MKKWISFVFVSFALLSTTVFGQRNVKDSIIGTPYVAIHYGGNWTQGDLADRFGFTNHIGFIAGYKTTKNWFWGLDGNFHFGNQLRMDDPLIGLRDSKGNITDQNGDIAAVGLLQRGFNTNLAIGKIFPILSPNVNSGIFVHAGIGYLAYKLRIETTDQVIPQIETDYRKGYDRLTTGINFHQFVGYSFMASRGFTNFYAGFYLQEGLTKNARTIFFDQPNEPVSKATRRDIQVGFKVGWIIPIYKRLPKDFYID